MKTDLLMSVSAAWTPIPAMDTFTRIVCRAANRIIVGAPVCESVLSLLRTANSIHHLGRNVDYCDINIQFAFKVVVTGTIINLFPEFARPFVSCQIQSVALLRSL